jgi:hypothetical protein
LGGKDDIKIARFTPTFGDVDGDGDMDLVFGAYPGRIYLSENTAGKGKTPVFAVPQRLGDPKEPFPSLNGWTIVRVCDLNSDGILDLVIFGQAPGDTICTVWFCPGGKP